MIECTYSKAVHLQRGFAQMPNVVLIQADKIVRDVAVLLFESSGFAIQAFDDATTVLKEVSWPEIDVLIAEISPSASDASFIRQVQQAKTGLPIIAISERLSPEQRQSLEQLPIHTAFEKPVTFDQLLCAVEKLASHRSAQKRELPHLS